MTSLLFPFLYIGHIIPFLHSFGNSSQCRIAFISSTIYVFSMSFPYIHASFGIPSYRGVLLFFSFDISASNSSSVIFSGLFGLSLFLTDFFGASLLPCKSFTKYFSHSFIFIVSTRSLVIISSFLFYKFPSFSFGRDAVKLSINFIYVFFFLLFA